MFEELMELEEKAKQLDLEMVDVKIETKERLDKYQDEYNETTRRLNDIDHLIELGENLSGDDIMGLFELRRVTLLYRRELKSVLCCYIPAPNAQALFNNGTVYRGEYSRYRKPPTHAHSTYSLRSDDSKNGSIIDFLDNVSYVEDKFPSITRCVNDKLLKTLRKYGTLQGG